MERMISNHKIQTALDEIKEISKIDLALYSEKGKQVAATFETGRRYGRSGNFICNIDGREPDVVRLSFTLK